MTESEAIEILKGKFPKWAYEGVYSDEDKYEYEMMQLATQALEEVQKYKKIGSIEECREAREKQIPKKPILKNGESRSFVDYENRYGEYKVTKWQD